MAILNFDATNVAPSAGFDPLPEGRYNVVITDSEMKQNKAGNGDYLQLEMEVIEGEFQGRKVWSRLNLNNPSEKAVRHATAELSAICHAVNVLTVSDSHELHNLPLSITVRCRKTQDGEIVNDIRKYEQKMTAVTVDPATAQIAPPWSTGR